MKRKLSIDAICFPALIVLSLLIFPFINLEASQYKSNWSSKGVEVNADPADWQGLPVTEDKNSKTAFAFQNDSENLFILFVFRDLKSLSSLQETGITVWISPEKDKKRNFGVFFKRIPLSVENLIAVLEKDGRVLTEEQKSNLRRRPVHQINQNKIITRGQDQEIPLRLNEMTAPQFSQKMVNQELYFEFRIPLSLLAEKLTGFTPGSALNLVFEWGGATPEMRKRAMSQQGANQGFGSDTGLSLDTEGRESGDARIAPQRGYQPPKKWTVRSSVLLAAALD